jgi:hypothetical protein
MHNVCFSVTPIWYQGRVFWVLQRAIWRDWWRIEYPRKPKCGSQVSGLRWDFQRGSNHAAAKILCAGEREGAGSKGEEGEGLEDRNFPFGEAWVEG